MNNLEVEFLATALQNRYNAEILQRLPTLEAPQAMLVAGCLFQSIWNAQSDRPLEENILDYDVFYFDDSDLSWDAEDAVIQRAALLFADLPIKVEVRNQARVHLWYEEKFGQSYAASRKCTDGIDRFLIAACCVGIAPAASEKEAPQVYATHGLRGMYAGVLQANTNNDLPELFLAKANSYCARWPHLQLHSE